MGFAVVVVLYSLMLQGDDNDISSPSWMVRTLGNSVGVAFSRRRYTPSYNTHLPLAFLCPAAGNAYG